MFSRISLFSRRLRHASGGFLLLLLAGVLAGCASFEPPRPYTTEAEALSARGEPTRRWSNDDGTTTLEYSTQPKDRKSTRLNSSHYQPSRMPSSA